ncbi:MAG: PKD domain-containing protein [Bacteroidota bacterium]
MKRFIVLVCGLCWLAGSGLFAQTNITAAEYFFDVDPGFGQGTSIPIATGADSLALDFSLPTTGLAPGRHLLYVRTKNALGIWSLTQAKGIYVRQETELPFTAAEYFFDTDPGFGLANSLPIETLNDTGLVDTFIQVPNLPLGSHILYVRVQSSDGSWSLFGQKEITICASYGPVAAYEVEQYGNMIAIRDQSLYGDTYVWDFGDGTTDTSRSPLHFFPGPGKYAVFLTLMNACGMDTMTHHLEIGGISESVPDCGGLDGIVSGVVNGYGFTSNNMDLSFVKHGGGMTLFPDTVIYANSQALFFRLDLFQADTGAYDIVYSLNGTPLMTLEKGFTVKARVAPALNITVAGPSLARPTRFMDFEVIIENTGNVDGLFVPVVISGIPQNSGAIQSRVVLTDSKVFGPYQEARNGLIADGGDPAIFDNPVFILPPAEIGGGTPSRDLSLIITNLPPGKNRIGFTAKLDKDTTVCIKATASPPMVKNDGSGDLSDCFATGMNCALQLGEEVLGLNDAIACAKTLFGALDLAFQKLAGTGIKQGAAQLATGGQVQEGKATVQQAITYTSYGALLGDLFWNCGPAVVQQFPALKIYSLVRKALKLIKKGKDAWSGASNTVAGASLLSCIYDTYQACSGQGGNPSHEKKFRAITSRDPNYKSGPGIPGDNFVNGQRFMPYTIQFENVSSASAAAQVVIIKDTLDPAVYDLSSFAFLSYGFDTLTYPVTKLSHSFTDLLDLRPAHPNFLRVEGQYKPQDGTVAWTFTTLDTTSLQLTDDPLTGFLPPNQTSPEGEGFVSFTISLKAGLSSGTFIRNNAEIIFDENAPIVTNTWENLYDINAPNSSVNPLAATLQDTSFLISWGGIDDAAGIGFYDVYVSENDEPFKLWMNEVAVDSFRFYGKVGQFYKFYSVATDKAGNQELPPADPFASPDAQTSIILSNEGLGFSEKIQLGQLYPSPVDQTLHLPINLSQPASLQLSIWDAMGRRMSRLDKSQDLAAGEHLISYEVSHLPAGVYTLQVRMGSRQLGQLFVKR